MQLTTASKLVQDDKVNGFYFTYQNSLFQGLILNAGYQDLRQVPGEGKDSVYSVSLQFFF